MNKKAALEHVILPVLAIIAVSGIMFILFTDNALTGYMVAISESFAEPKPSDTIYEKYSLGGNCIVDSDCTRKGCYNEFCLSKDNALDVSSSCVWKENFPQVNDFSCGCYSNKCVWFRK